MESPNLREVKPRQGGPEISVTSLFRLDERTILITGGIGYMGVATAKSVLELGGDVICLDYYKSLDYEVWGTVESSATKFEGKAWSYSVDVTDVEKVRSVIEQALTKTRYPLRGMIACAGISGESPVVDYPVDLFRRIIDVNLSGAFICVQAAAREICKHKYSASIVLVASMSGHGSNKGVDTAAYNSSKSGVHQLARSLAAEWGSRPEYPLIRVNSLSPGYIRTPMTNQALAYPKREEEWSADNMLNRLSFIDEYRGPIVYLLSDASSFMTGADLRVDGGHTAW